MAFKLKGSELYGKLNLNRNMGDTSKKDGRADSSAFQQNEEEGDEKPSIRGQQSDYNYMNNLLQNLENYGSEEERDRMWKKSGANLGEVYNLDNMAGGQIIKDAKARASGAQRVEEKNQERAAHEAEKQAMQDEKAYINSLSPRERDKYRRKKAKGKV